MTILHSKSLAEYKYSACTHKIFISFEHTVSSDRSLFTLLNKQINFDIYALETIYLAISLPWMVKTLALYGLIFTVFLYGLIFTWTFYHKLLYKKQPHHQWQLTFSENLKLRKQAYVWKRLCSFVNQLHCMVNWLMSLHDTFFK